MDTAAVTISFYVAPSEAFLDIPLVLSDVGMLHVTRAKLLCRSAVVRASDQARETFKTFEWFARLRRSADPQCCKRSLRCSQGCKKASLLLLLHVNIMVNIITKSPPENQARLNY